MKRHDGPTVQRSASRALGDPSLWAVVAGNAVAIVLALVEGWDLGEVMWIYWGQSVMIGVANVWRMMALKDFSTQGMKVNGQPVPETPAAKRDAAIFFAFHYGFFHADYAAFLWQQWPFSGVEGAPLLLLALLGFALSHGYSLRYNATRDFRDARPNLGALMAYPYLRILPMHLTILFGLASGSGALLLFMILKMLADAGTHVAEHRLFQRRARMDSPVIRD